MPNVFVDVAVERQSQKDKGYTPDHDAEHGPLPIISAAISYAMADIIGCKSSPPILWPWEDEAWKPRDRRANLIRAAALLVAAIEAMDRIDADILHNP